MKFARRIGALLGAVAATGAATASASPLSPTTYGPVRAWGATEIQSLDPARHSGAVSDRTSRRDQVLSNENTFTRWAYVTKIAWIHQAPGGSSPRIERLELVHGGWVRLDLPGTARGLGCPRPRVGEAANPRAPQRTDGLGAARRARIVSPDRTCLVVVDREQRRMYFYSRRPPDLERAGGRR